MLPTQKPLETNLRRVSGAVIIDLHGEINGLSEDSLSAAYAGAEEKDTKTIILNFTNVEYINSTGIALIVGLLSKARASGRTISAYGLSEHYEDIFRITRLSDFIDLHSDEPSALDGSTNGGEEDQP